MTGLAPELVDVLRCPRCRGALTVDGAALRCDACGLRFAVTDGIADMRIPPAPDDTARPERRGTISQ